MTVNYLTHLKSGGSRYVADNRRTNDGNRRMKADIVRIFGEQADTDGFINKGTTR